MPKKKYPRLEPIVGDSIQETAARAIEIVKAEGKPCHFTFNEIEMVVALNATVADVVADYHALSEERAAEYRKSPEYKRAQKEREERDRKRAAERAAALEKAPPEPDMSRDAAAWRKAVEINRDGYGGAVITYAARWARMMEGAIAGGGKLAEVASSLSHAADEEGITGFMYGCAVSILAKSWIHGEELRKWHNAEYGVDESKAKGGTVNPAVLTLG